MIFRRSLAWTACALAAACAPTFNWREVALPDGTSQALFPCKPSRERRTVPLAGVPAEMTVMACRTGDVMFAIAMVEVQDPRRLGPTLVAMKEAALANVRGRATPEPLSVAGANPHAAAGAFKVAGSLPDGRPLEERLALFAYGTRVYQVTAFAARLPDEPSRVFFGSIRLQ